LEILTKITKKNKQTNKMFNSSNTKRIKIEAANATLVEGHHEDSDDGVHTTKIIGSSSGSGGNPVTYKLISPAGSGSNTATVLTQPLSGQFYVIGNPSEVQASNSGSSGGGAGRVIAPKATLTLANNSPPSSLRCVFDKQVCAFIHFFEDY
jgi:hypothetical protein